MITINRAQVAAKIGVHKQTIWRWYKKKQFPAPIELTPKTFVWDEADVDNWLTSKKEMQNERSRSSKQAESIGPAQ